MRRHQGADQAASTRPKLPEVRPLQPMPSATTVSHPPVASNVVQRAAADPASLSPADVLALQGLIGNRATARLLDAASAGRSPRPRPPAIQFHLTVGSATDPAEHEANRIADAVMQAREAAAPAVAQGADAIQLQAAAVAPMGPEGGVIGHELEARLAANRGHGLPLPPATRELMEDHLGADFAAVRVHTGPDAQMLSRHLGAEAFTHGADIYLGAGRYVPGTAAGDWLLAHELTHVVQQGATAQRVHRQSAGAGDGARAGGLIQRKLAGVRAAVIQLGGEPTWRMRAYARILDSLAAYERAEVAYLARHQAQLQADERADLYGQLAQLEQLVVNWLAKNRSDRAAQFRSYNRNLGEELPTLAAETEEERQYHALTMLLPRLRHERREISANRFYSTHTWADRTLTGGEDAALGGQLNLLDKVEHATAEGTSAGVFISDKAIASPSKSGDKLGLATVDPNRGAHAVAMYQLAQLLDLGVDVIAKTEFATHSSTTNRKEAGVHLPFEQAQARMGVRMEWVTGAEPAGRTAFTITAAEAAGERDAGVRDDDAAKRATISLEDPILQRSLNALQLIDAIAGQLDRHGNNYYIRTNQAGQVLGVVGIDLDQAFAPNQTSVAPKTLSPDDPLETSFFVGMPQLVDRDFAQRILSVGAEAVRALLSVYLEPAEVEAAVTRFTLVQEACAGVLARGEAVQPEGWGAATARTTLSAGAYTSYLVQMAEGTTRATYGQDSQRISNDGRLHKRVREGLCANLLPRLEPLIWYGQITTQEARLLVAVIVANLVRRQKRFGPDEVGPDVEAQEQVLENLMRRRLASWPIWLTDPKVDPAMVRKLKQHGGAA